MTQQFVNTEKTSQNFSTTNSYFTRNKFFSVELIVLIFFQIDVEYPAPLPNIMTPPVWLLMS